MKMVIDIPKKTYNEIKERTIITCGEIFAKNLVRRIRNGTPLPEHHGRLVDADALEEKVEKHRRMLKISEYDRELVLHYTDIEMAPTIIEGSDSK